MNVPDPQPLRCAADVAVTGAVGGGTYRGGVCGRSEIICDKGTIRYTIVDDEGQIDDGELIVRPSSDTRGEQLDYLLTDLEELLRRTDPVVVYVKSGRGGRYGAGPERCEGEAVVQVAAHRAAVPCEMLTSEQLRAAAGAAQGKGVYKALLQGEDVTARPSKDKGERCLYAITGLRSRRG